jgi:hypothetical protein
MNNIRTKLIQDAIELPNCPGKSTGSRRPYIESLALHPFAKRAQRPNHQHNWLVAQIPLQFAHLRDQSLYAAHFHAVHYMRNLHAG